MALAALTFMGGCAGDLATPLETQAVPGGYVLSADEHTWTCPRLTNGIGGRVTRIVALTAAGQRESVAPPPTVARAFTRAFGPQGADSMSLAQLKTERAAADAYNEKLRAKGCVTVDVDAKIASAPPAPPPPPESEAKKKKGRT